MLSASLIHIRRDALETDYFDVVDYCSRRVRNVVCDGDRCFWQRPRLCGSRLAAPEQCADPTPAFGAGRRFRISSHGSPEKNAGHVHRAVVINSHCCNLRDRLSIFSSKTRDPTKLRTASCALITFPLLLPSGPDQSLSAPASAHRLKI